MTTFTRAELRALPPSDLADLIRMAIEPGDDWSATDTAWKAAMTLGLDPTNPNDRKAVEAAWRATSEVPESFSSPVGAGHPGVRSDLTLPGAEPALPTPGQGVAPTAAESVPEGADELGLPPADPEGARTLADTMARSAATGQPFMAGTFALYADPTGAVVLVTQDADGNVKRSVVPRKAVRLGLSLMAGEGGPLSRLLGRRMARG